MQASLNRRERGRPAVLSLSGDIVLNDAADLYAELCNRAQDPELRELEVDFSNVRAIDTAGAAATKLGVELFESSGRRLELTHLSEQHSEALALVMEPREPPKERTPPRSFFDWLASGATHARSVVGVAEGIVDTTWSGVRTLARRDKRRLIAVAEQVAIAADATFIVAVLSFLIGVILAFQGAYQLSKFGASAYMAELVSLGMVREFGPIITAIILSGRSGASIAAELGTMAVNDEVDALSSMGISTSSYLVLPRVAGLTFAVPLLTVLSMAIGIGAGIAMGDLLNIPYMIAFHRMQSALVLNDFVLGLFKSVLFGLIIGFVGCFTGLATRGGPRSVGTSTTRAVVLSILYVVITDSIVTTAWTLSHGTRA